MSTLLTPDLFVANSIILVLLTFLGFRSLLRKLLDSKDPYQQTIASTRRLLEKCDSSSVHCSSYLDCFGSQLRRLYQRTKDVNHLYESTAFYVLAAEACPQDSIRAVHLTNVSRSMMVLFLRTACENDLLEKCVSYGRQAISLLSPKDPQRCSSLLILSLALRLQFESSRRNSNLKKAIAFNKEALAIHPEHSVTHFCLLFNLASALQSYFEQTREISDLDLSIELYHEALRWTVANSRFHSAILEGLGKALLLRAPNGIGQPENSTCCSLCRLDVRSLPMVPESRFRPSLVMFGRAIGQLGPDDLNTFFSLHSDYHPSYFHSHSFPAENRSDNSNRRENLKKAISCNRGALDFLPEHDPRRFLVLADIAHDSRALYMETKNPKNLDEAISIYHAALSIDHSEYSDPNAIFLLSEAVSVLHYTRYEKNSESEDVDVDECSKLADAARELCPKEDVQSLSRCLDNVVVFSRIRFDRFREFKSLNYSIQCGHDLLALLSRNNLDRSSAQLNLAPSLVIRFDCTGELADLEEAIGLLQDAHDKCSGDNSLRSEILGNLAGAMRIRFFQHGQMEDLTTSIDLYNGVDRHKLESDAETQANLAGLLLERFRRTKREDDLTKAVNGYCRTRELMGEKSPGYPALLCGHSKALLAQFDKYGDKEYIDEAIRLTRRALDSCDDERDSIYFPTLGIRADYLRFRYVKYGEINDIEESIDNYRRILDFQKSGHHPRQSTFLCGLADSLRARFQITAEMTSFEDAASLYRRAIENTSSSLPSRLDIACNWAKDARSLCNLATTNEAARSLCESAAIDAYTCALSLLERSLNLSPSLQLQHERLSDSCSYPTLSVDAASYAIERGDLKEAVEILEQGRGLLWSQMRGFRTPLDSLADATPDLAARFKDINNKLETLLMSPASVWKSTQSWSTSPIQDPKSIDALRREQRELSQQQDDLIAQIRKIEGFSNFLLRRTPFEELQRSADVGPVILINHSTYRSDAITLLGGKRNPVLVPLSLTSRNKASAECSTSWFYDEAAEEVRKLQDSRRKHLKEDTSRYDAQLLSALRWSWKNIVSPIVEAFNVLKPRVKKKSRIWWCPTSVLSHLPLHAAGPYKNRKGCTVFLLDDYVSSYAPTLKALIEARSNITPTGAMSSKGPMLLAIGCAGKDPNSKLPNVTEEIKTVKECVPNAICREEKAATKATVLDQLRTNHSAHFSCHGHLSSDNPFDSSFELFNNERLTLTDIVNLNNKETINAELAFLSACHSAERAPGSAPEESMHLAAAMQFCGFRSVIGTMWEMNDDDGCIVVRKFYRGMVQEKKSSADALRGAVIHLRNPERKECGVQEDKTNGEHEDEKGRKEEVRRSFMEGWVNFIHIGA